MQPDGNTYTMNKREKQKGLSLVELIVAVALLSIVFSAVFTILKNSYAFWQVESKSISLEGQLRSIQDIMLRDLRPCKSAIVVQDGSTIRLFFSQTDTIPKTTLNDSTYFEYDSSNHTLYRALVGETGWAKNPLSRQNIVVSPISDIFTVQIVAPSFYFIQVNLVALEGPEEKAISFSVTTRRPK
jgi:prepilin-type N-terminal cleavage/methylation domain-containing protein